MLKPFPHRPIALEYMHIFKQVLQLNCVLACHQWQWEDIFKKPSYINGVPMKFQKMLTQNYDW